MRNYVLHTLRQHQLLHKVNSETAEVLHALLHYLAGSHAAIVLVNLEDLWLEDQPQNMPGVSPDQFPSWRRKAAKRVDELQSDPAIRELLANLVDRRSNSAVTTTHTSDYNDRAMSSQHASHRAQQEAADLAAKQRADS